jgi:hypothetical protein
MTVHEKARAYEALKKDYELILEMLEKHYKDGEEYPQRPDLIQEKEVSAAMYYAKLAGAMQGHNSGLNYLIGRMKGYLKFYEELK